MVGDDVPFSELDAEINHGKLNRALKDALHEVTKGNRDISTSSTGNIMLVHVLSTPIGGGDTHVVLGKAFKKAGFDGVHFDDEKKAYVLPINDGSPVSGQLEKITSLKQSIQQLTHP